MHQLCPEVTGASVGWLGGFVSGTSPGFAGLVIGVVGVVEAGTVVVVGGAVVNGLSSGVVGFEPGTVTIVGVGVYGGKFAGFVTGVVVESSNLLTIFCSFLCVFPVSDTSSPARTDLEMLKEERSKMIMYREFGLAMAGFWWVFGEIPKYGILQFAL